MHTERQMPGDLFVPNVGPPNSQNFGNRNGNQNNFGNPFSNDRFDQNNQGTNSNFYDDFDFNELSRDVNNLDRQANNNRNFNPRKNFQANFNNDNPFANSNMSFNNQNKQFDARGGNMNSFGGNADGDRFNNDNISRNFNSNQDEQLGGQHHVIHMRGLPYYTDEMDVFNVSSSDI